MAGGPDKGKVDMKELREKQQIARSQALRTNQGYIPEAAYRERRHYFTAKVASAPACTPAANTDLLGGPAGGAGVTLLCRQQCKDVWEGRAQAPGEGHLSVQCTLCLPPCHPSGDHTPTSHTASGCLPLRRRKREFSAKSRSRARPRSR